MKTIKKCASSSVVYLLLLLFAATGAVSCKKAEEVAPIERETSVEEDPVEIEEPPGDTGPDTTPGDTGTALEEEDSELPKDLELSFLSEVWANSGEDKVTPEELRATQDAAAVVNGVWDGERVTLFGSKNEVIAFNVIIEAGTEPVTDVSVEFDKLSGPGTAEITSKPVTGDGVFDWVDRQIEMFYVRYLEIKGLSVFAYENYDERHIPERLRRPFSGEGVGSGDWYARPGANKKYPDIAVPIELQGSFDVAAGQNQSVWVDVYIPKDAAVGTYTGHFYVKEGDDYTQDLPVELEVVDITLPDTPHLKTMLFIGYDNINARYLNESWPSSGSQSAADSIIIRDRHFQMAHRHKLSLIDANNSPEPGIADAPKDEWIPRLNGTLFTADNDYDGPGVNVGNNVFSVGTYSSWGWKGEGETGMHAHANAWAGWFNSNAPNTEYFLYLLDESSDYAQMEQWSTWLNNAPAPGNQMKSFATISLPHANDNVPSLDVPCNIGVALGDIPTWDSIMDNYRDDPTKDVYFYNGRRPWTGTFATDDDGVSLRASAWTQFKFGIDRWFYWEGTYYNDYQGGRGQTNVFQTAQTFGATPVFNSVKGETGWMYGNGDGLLFYPGTDRMYPAESYFVLGPIASLRLKYWRRGVQDGDYLKMAYDIDPGSTTELVEEILPKGLWKYGTTDPNDPSWVRTDISWTNDPDIWDQARAELVEIILGGI